MSDVKLTSDEVPKKFAEWLLAMGCPTEKVPLMDRVPEMCRGQYYIVWRSLMEHVESKDVIRRKRLQVFCDDMRQSQKKNILIGRDTSAQVPQLALWKQQVELKQKVAAARDRVTLAQQDLTQLVDKITSKMSRRNMSRRRMEVAQRRAWLLTQGAEELRTKLDNLRETKTIAHALCAIDDDGDIQSKLDKCIASLRRQAVHLSTSASVSQLSVANLVASSSVLSAFGEPTDFEEQLQALVRCRGDALCAQLYERRAGLVAALSAGGASSTDKRPRHRENPRSVLAHTAALYNKLALEATKSRVRFQQAGRRLVAAVNDLNTHLTEESCELLVVICEKVDAQARVNTLRALLDELQTNSGVFEAGGQTDDRSTVVRSVAAVDRAIESKKAELNRVIVALAVMNWKLQNVSECLTTRFNAFRTDSLHDRNQYKADLVALLRRFYGAHRERRRNRVELSMNLEASDCSYDDAIDKSNPRFINELRIYLKKFHLEKNRKLILQSGKKIWIFETVDASVNRLHTRWLSEDLPCSLVCPSRSAVSSVQRVKKSVSAKAGLEAMPTCDPPTAELIDISIQTEEEDEIIDKIKKRLNENLLSLQKTSKTLDRGQEDLKLWSKNLSKSYISTHRIVNGMTYKGYEINYLENCING